MTIPAINSMGPTAGRSVGAYTTYILGSGFRQTPDVDSEFYIDIGGVVVVDWPETVKVEVNGVAADSVEVLSATVIKFNMPAYNGDPKSLPATVDVVVSNLDSDEVVIAGETVTATEIFTYKQKDLTSRSHLLGVIASLVLSLRNGIIPNVSMTQDVDWTSMPTSEDRPDSDAELPAIYVLGPRLQDYKEDKSLQEDNILVESEDSEDEYKHRKDPVTANCVFTIMGVSNNKSESINMAQAFIEWSQAIKEIRAYRNPNNLESEALQYSMGLTPDGQPDFSSRSGLHQWAASIIIDGVQMTPEEHLIVDEGYTVYDGTELEWAMGLPFAWLTTTRKEND